MANNWIDSRANIVLRVCSASTVIMLISGVQRIAYHMRQSKPRQYYTWYCCCCLLLFLHTLISAYTRVSHSNLNHFSCCSTNASGACTHYTHTHIAHIRTHESEWDVCSRMLFAQSAVCIGLIVVRGASLTDNVGYVWCDTHTYIYMPNPYNMYGWRLCAALYVRTAYICQCW